MNSNSKGSMSPGEDPSAGPTLTSLITSCSGECGDLPEESRPVSSPRWTKVGHSTEQHNGSFSCPYHQAGIRKRLSDFPVRIFLQDVTSPPPHHRKFCGILAVVLFLTLMNVGQAVFLGYLWYNR